MTWYTKEFGEQLQMSKAHEARASIAKLARTAKTEKEIAKTRAAADKALELVAETERDVAEVKVKQEDARKSRVLQGQRRVVRSQLVLYHRLPSSEDKAQLQAEVSLLQFELETAQLESSLVDELNVRLACMQKRHEVATGGLFFQRDFATEASERAVLEEVAAGGWSVEGISLVGYLRASTETDLSLLYLGSAVGAELARRVANRRLADAQAAKAVLQVLLDAEQDTLTEEVTRSADGTVTAKTVVIKLSKTAALGKLETELQAAKAAQGEWTPLEADRRRTKQTQHAMQSLITAREQRAQRQMLEGGIEFVAVDRARKEVDAGLAQEQVRLWTHGQFSFVPRLTHV